MNVVLIVIDGLGKKDLPFVRDVCPTLWRLISTGKQYENVYANGCPTEFALPGILSSEWLLNDPSRWAGLSNKRLTAAEYFMSKSYVSASFSPVYRPRSNGYRRGYSHFYNPFCPRTLLKEIDQGSNWYLDEYLSGRISYEAFGKYLIDLLNESVTGLASLDSQYGISTEVINELQEELQSHPDLIIEDFLRRKKLRILDILDNTIKKRVLSQRNQLSVILLYTMMTFLAFLYGGANRLRITYSFIQRLFGTRLSKSKFSSAEKLTDKYVSWLGRQTGSTFAFVHLLDFHEKNYFGFEVGKISVAWMYKLLKFMILQRRHIDKIHHVMALFYIDDQIRKLVSFLEARGSYLIAITSDHGNIDFSKEQHVFHKTFDFSDQYYHVPFVIYKAGSEGGVNRNLGSSIDIVPTIIWDVFSETESRFSGEPLQVGGRDHVFFENTGRGPTDVEIKPIYIALKRMDKKIKFRFCLDAKSTGGAILRGDVLDVRDDMDGYLPFSVVTSEDLTEIVSRVRQVYGEIGKRLSLVRLQIGPQMREVQLQVIP